MYNAVATAQSRPNYLLLTPFKNEAKGYLHAFNLFKVFSKRAAPFIDIFDCMWWWYNRYFYIGFSLRIQLDGDRFLSDDSGPSLRK